MSGWIVGSESRVCGYCIAVLCAVLLWTSMGSTGTASAQELSEEVMQTALMQYTLEYQFDRDLQVGDWVKYQFLEDGDDAEEIELKVTKRENGGVWIVEKTRGMELHALVDLGSMELLAGFAIDPEGNRHEGDTSGR